MSLPLTHTYFGGRDGEQQNALRSAMDTAAKMNEHRGDYGIYAYLDEVPITSLTVELVQALNRHGYEITKINKKEN